MDLWVTEKTFIQIADTYLLSRGPIFESKEYLVTSLGALIIIGKKKRTARIFPSSIPIIQMGYKSISSENLTDVTTVDTSFIDDWYEAVKRNFAEEEE